MESVSCFIDYSAHFCVFPLTSKQNHVIAFGLRGLDIVLSYSGSYELLLKVYGLLLMEPFYCNK